VETEARKVVPVLEAEERQGFAEVELGFAEQVAMEECKRCLNCSIFAEIEAPETAEVRGIGIKIAPGAYVHVLPIEAGFVGADNVGVLITEAPYNQDSMELVIDIGTNGELIMGNRQKLISSSCATGPAFEGAEIKYGMRAAPGAIEKIVIDKNTFGSYIDKESAACLGLFPDCNLENIFAVGNAAGDGARIALLNADKRREADEMARKVEYVELTLEPDFDKIFSQAMWLPHMKDAFPHLNHLLPEKTV